MILASFLAAQPTRSPLAFSLDIAALLRGVPLGAGPADRAADGAGQAADVLIRRAQQPPEMRQDATIIVDECHNFLHLPVGMDDALAEARGYRISLVLAHQHLAQLPADVAHAVDANARNKIYFTVSPDDARHLVRHTAPVFDDWDLATRPGFHASARVLHHGQALPAFFIAAAPLPDPPPGR
jgi:hypothetical protein